jgi:hypothetical protein
LERSPQERKKREKIEDGETEEARKEEEALEVGLFQRNAEGSAEFFEGGWRVIG